MIKIGNKMAKKAKTEVQDIIYDEKDFSYSTTNNSPLSSSFFGKNDADYYMSKVKGVVGVCADKISSFVSTQTLRLYKIDRSVNVKGLSKVENKHLFDPSKVGQKSANYANQEGVSIVEVTQSPLLDILHKPNSLYFGTEQSFILQWHRLTTGNSYQYINKDESGNVISLDVLYPQYVSVAYDKFGAFVGYNYKVGNNNIFMKREDVIHQRHKPARSGVLGEGVIHNISTAADILNEMDAREYNFQKNDCRPDFVVRVPVNADPTKMVETETALKAKLKGAKNKGNPIVLKDSTIENIGWSPRDLEQKVLREAMLNLVLAGFGVPESELSKDSTNASAKTANIQYLRNLNPLLIKNQEELTHSLIPLFYDDPENYFLAYDDIFPEAQPDYLELAKNNFITVNELRSHYGYSSLEGHSELVKPVEATPAAKEDVVKVISSNVIEKKGDEIKPIEHLQAFDAIVDDDVQLVEELKKKFNKSGLVENKSLVNKMFTITEENF